MEHRPLEEDSHLDSKISRVLLNPKFHYHVPWRRSR